MGIEKATHTHNATGRKYFYENSTWKYWSEEEQMWIKSIFSSFVTFVESLIPLDAIVQKEYLQLVDGVYKLVVLSDVVDGHEGLIEVPEGADFYGQDGIAGIKNNFFFKENSVLLNDKWVPAKFNVKNIKLLWIRKSEEIETPKTLSFRCKTEPASDVDVTLADRKSQYGDFKDVSDTTLKIMDNFALGCMSSVQSEALHMICSKLARIANGDANHVDSWHDIAGYATLVVKELERK